MSERLIWKILGALWLSIVLSAILFTALAKADVIQLTASWYSVSSLKSEGTWRYSNGRCADGSFYRDGNLTCASCDCPLGTMVLVTNTHNGKSVTVRVTDRTNKRFKGKRIDLTPKAFKIISPSGSLKEGLIPVTVEVVK
jgi:rare lipoprotein A